MKLNQYACALEQALIQSLEHQKSQASALGEYVEYVGNVVDLLKALGAEREGMRNILSDPDTLADYVKGFFGPEGPCPVQTPGEQARQALVEGAVTPNSRLMPAGNPEAFMDPQFAAAMQQAQGQQPQQVQPQPVQRPVMPMPAPGGGPAGMAGSSEALWEQFSQMMDVDPANAWQVLSAMPQDALRTKIIAVE